MPGPAAILQGAVSTYGLYNNPLRYLGLSANGNGPDGGAAEISDPWCDVQPREFKTSGIQVGP